MTGSGSDSSVPNITLSSIGSTLMVSSSSSASLLGDSTSSCAAISIGGLEPIESIIDLSSNVGAVLFIELWSVTIFKSIYIEI